MCAWYKELFILKTIKNMSK